MKKLLVGDVGEYLAQAAKKINHQAVLLNNKTYRMIENQNGVYYTSLGDITDRKKFCHVLMCADEIIFCPPTDDWSDKDHVNRLGDQKFSMESEIKEHLYQWMCIKQTSVTNLRLLEFNSDTWQVSPRISNHKQIWNIGCSITNGYGVDPQQRYGQLIADKLNLPITFIAQDGASNEWVANKILMADVTKGDTVIWGLTSLNRYSYALHRGRFYHVNHMFYNNYPLMEKIVPLSWLESPNNFYHTINAIGMVRNFCKKIEANLVLLGFRDSEYYLPYCELLNLGQEKWTDRATDGRHPGPRSHQIFADQTIEYINKLGIKL